MTLLLGPPGSGRSTLLQLLAGRLSSSRVVTLNGRVTYNGLGLERFVAAKTASYVDQVCMCVGVWGVRGAHIQAVCLTN
jgi:ABC-type multidrug transport system ATPase subunit